MERKEINSELTCMEIIQCSGSRYFVFDPCYSPVLGSGSELTLVRFQIRTVRLVFVLRDRIPDPGCLQSGSRIRIVRIPVLGSGSRTRRLRRFGSPTWIRARDLCKMGKSDIILVYSAGFGMFTSPYIRGGGKIFVNLCSKL